MCVCVCVYVCRGGMGRSESGLNAWAEWALDKYPLNTVSNKLYLYCILVQI